jgi:hypothetical protein
MMAEVRLKSKGQFGEPAVLKWRKEAAKRR